MLSQCILANFFQAGEPKGMKCCGEIEACWPIMYEGAYKYGKKRYPSSLPVEYID